MYGYSLYAICSTQTSNDALYMTQLIVEVRTLVCMVFSLEQWFFTFEFSQDFWQLFSFFFLVLQMAEVF